MKYDPKARRMLERHLIEARSRLQLACHRTTDPDLDLDKAIEHAERGLATLKAARSAVTPIDNDRAGWGG